MLERDNYDDSSFAESGLAAIIDDDESVYFSCLPIDYSGIRIKKEKEVLQQRCTSEVETGFRY